MNEKIKKYLSVITGIGFAGIALNLLTSAKYSKDEVESSTNEKEKADREGHNALHDLIDWTRVQLTGSKVINIILGNKETNSGVTGIQKSLTEAEITLDHQHKVGYK